MSRSLDGRLGGEEAKALDAHVAGCADCAKELAVLRGLHAALRGVGRAEPPAGLARRAALAAWSAQRAGKTVREAPWWSELFRFAMPAAAVSAVAAIALVAVGSASGPANAPSASDPAAIVSIDRDAVLGEGI